jgi:hypothetical protein
MSNQSLARHFLKVQDYSSGLVCNFFGFGIYLNSQNIAEIANGTLLTRVPFIEIANRFSIDSFQYKNFGDHIKQRMIDSAKISFAEREDKLFCSLLRKIDIQLIKINEIEFNQGIRMKAIVSRKISSALESTLTNHESFRFGNLEIIESDFVKENEIFFLEDEKFYGFMPIQQELTFVEESNRTGSIEFAGYQKFGMAINDIIGIQRHQIKRNPISKYQFMERKNGI